MGDELEVSSPFSWGVGGGREGTSIPGCYKKKISPDFKSPQIGISAHVIFLVF